MKSLYQMQAEVHEYVKDKGWWTQEPPVTFLESWLCSTKK